MSSPCILLVEDSTTQALQITHILEEQGWQVVWKSTGEEAVQEIRALLQGGVLRQAA